MRRIAVALSVLLIASPALAGRVLVIRQNAAASNEFGNTIAKQTALLESVLRRLGVDFDEVEQQVVAQCPTCPSQNAGQKAIISGTVGYGNMTRTYAGIIHMGFTVGGGSGSVARVTGYNPDTLTLANASGGNTSTWPAVPTWFMGIGNVPNGGIYATAATCSTGVAGTMTAYSDNTTKLSMYMVGQPEVWGSGSAVYYSTTNGLTILSGTPGITKARLVVGANSMAFRDNGTSSCTDCDSLGRGSTYSSSPGCDTAIVWTRQRSTNDAAPLIFSLPSWASNGGTTTDAMTEAMCVAIMDSASGGQIIGAKAGWKPLKVGFVISGAFVHSKGDVNSTGLWGVHGVNYPSDTSLVKAGIDSLASLNVPVVVTANLDSIASYPAEKAWWATRLPLAKFSPESRIYIDSCACNSGETNLSSHLFPDAFGLYRTRGIITNDRYNYGTQCDGSDTTLSCALSFMRSTMDSIPEFHARMSSTLLAPYWDYFPAGRLRYSLPDPDSMATAMSRSGFTTALVGVMFPSVTPSFSWGVTAGGTAGPPTSGPGAYYPNPRVQTIHGFNGQTTGQFKWLSFRHIDEDDSNNFPGVAHQIHQEFWNGFWQRPWYEADSPYWYHVMRTNLSVIVIRAGDLGWQKDTGHNPTRPGYFFIKWTVNQARAINKFAGRTIISFDYPENIDP